MIKIGVCVKEKALEKYIVRLFKGMLPEQEQYEFVSLPVNALIGRETEMFEGYPVFIVDESIFHDEGIETVEYLSRIRPETDIIMVEGEKEDNISGKKYHVFAYHMRRLKQNELAGLLRQSLKRVSENPRDIVIKSDGEEITIPINNILYAESRNRHIILHTITGEYEYGEKMYVLEDLLESEGFVRCHQSFMVAKQYVTDIDSRGIWLEQECIPVGRTYKDQVAKEFIEVADDEYVRSADSLEGIIVKRGASDDGKKTEKQGVLIGVRGIHKGVKFHFRPEERILVGRSEKAADIVINQPLASRIHCVIVFHESDNSYEVVDFSKNGTFLQDKKRLAPDTGYILKPGTEISFGDCDNVYRLG